VIDPPSKLRIAEHRVGDVTVLVLTGALTLDDGDLGLRRHVHGLLEEGRNKILLDLGGVSLIDSAGAGMLVAKLKTVRDRNGDLKLLNMSPRTSRVLGSMKMLTAFEVFEEEAQAVRSFDVEVRGA